MKFGMKLILGFLAVALVCAAVGIFGIVNLKRITSADTFLYEKDDVASGRIGGHRGQHEPDEIRCFQHGQHDRYRYHREI